MKTGKVPTLVVHLFSCSIFPLTLFTLFCLSVFSSSVSDNHKNHLAYDLRKSSGVSLFFILSFMIITLSLGSGASSNSCQGDHYDRFFPSFPLVNEVETTNKINREIEVYYFYDSSDDDEYHHHGYDGYDEDNDMDIEDMDDSSEEDNDDRELERRIEEFIAKVYHKRREELIADRVLWLTAA